MKSLIFHRPLGLLSPELAEGEIRKSCPHENGEWGSPKPQCVILEFYPNSNITILLINFKPVNCACQSIIKVHPGFPF